jgi:regulator of sirC expression with transglutaminase-like and TPR domain
MICRQEAFDLFAQSLPQLSTTAGLLQAATAVSLHALEDADPRQVDGYLQGLANRVLARVRHGHPAALIAHLHEVLFEEEGFHGERARYYSPLNSYLPTVVERRCGIPVTLSLLYKVVGERVGLKIDGLNTPAHFLVRVHDGDGWLIVDPYHRGAVLSPTEAVVLIESVLGKSFDPSAPFVIEAASHARWIGRVLTNLQVIFAEQGCERDLIAMHELQALLKHANL